MKTNQKVFQMVTVVALFIAVVFISVGFALMSTSLSVTGQAKIVPAKWDVHFVPSTYHFSDNSTAATDTTDTTAAGYTFDATTFSGYEITLTKPGDKGTITFDVENDGDLDAEIANYNLGSLVVTGTGATAAADEAIVNRWIIYTVTWDDDTAIADGQLLAKKASGAATGTRKTIKIEVEYDENATDLPTNEVTVSGRNLSFSYQQAN